MQQLDLFGFPIETPAPKKKEKAPTAKAVTVIAPAEPKKEERTETTVFAGDAGNPVAQTEPIPESPSPTTLPEPVTENTPEPVIAAPVAIEPVVTISSEETIVPKEEAKEPIIAVTASPETITPPVVASLPPTPAEPVKTANIAASQAAPAKQAGKRGRKSFKEMDSEADLVEVPDDETLQKKLYYSISEVAGWFKVNTSLLRYWENEFDVLQPRKTRKGDRLFRVEDIKNLQLIYFLLRQRKFSIDGAKNYLKNNRQEADTQIKLVESLTRFRSFLLEMKATLQA